MKAVLLSVVVGLFAVATGVAQECVPNDPAATRGIPSLKVENVSFFDELSDSTPYDTKRVFVIRFNREVRNRSGFLIVDKGDKSVRLPILSTVAEDDGKIPAYDEATHQLEIQEEDVDQIAALDATPEERTAFFNELKGKKVRLELEACRREFNPLVTELKDAHYQDPGLSRPGHPFELLRLGISESIPYRTNGDFRSTIRVASELKYVWFFLYPPDRTTPQSEAHIYNKLLHSDLTAEQIGQALVGRRVGLKSSGGRPWQPLASPFPQTR